MTRLLLVLVLLAAACDDPFIAEQTRAYQSVATGGDHSCAVSEAGEAYCWGRGLDGELGIGVKENRSTPARVAGGLTFTQITAGDNHTCALTTDGTAYCWGWNAFYERGNPTDARDAEPVPVTTDRKFRSISAGAHHTCALTLDSLAYCWGNGRYGQLGLGNTQTGDHPYPVLGGLKFAQLSAGAWHTCAVTAAGSGYCWGRNDLGQLGIGSSVVFTTEPTALNTSVRFRQIDGGATHTCGVSTTNRLYCWGSNEHGELGDGSAFKPGVAAATVPSPVSELFPSGVSIDAGASHTCAIAGNGRGRCWGRGEFGQLANGGTSDQYHPQPVDLLARDITFTALALGGTTHDCAIVDDSVYCWGTGYAGQLGVEQSTFAALPQRVHD